VIRNIRQYCSTVDILLYGIIIQDRGGFVNADLPKNRRILSEYMGINCAFCAKQHYM